MMALAVIIMQRNVDVPDICLMIFHLATLAATAAAAASRHINGIMHIEDAPESGT